MKIGLIGFGSIGERHYKNLLASGLVKKIVVLSARTDLRDVAVAHTWSEFAAQGPYDAIFITNETAKHRESLKKASLLTKAIFVEKPLSHNAKNLKTAVKILAKKKISVWVGYNLHFFKPLLAVKKIIASKKMGKILHVRATVGQDLRGWRERDYKEIYSAKKKQGGGVMLDLVHDLNYPSWLLGEPLKPVAAVVRKSSSLVIDAEDTAESLLITKSGVVVSVHQDYYRVPGKRSLEIVGEKGTVEWNSENNDVVFSYATGRQEQKFANERNTMYEDEIRFFLNEVKAKKYFSNANEAVVDVLNIETLKKYGKK